MKKESTSPEQTPKGAPEMLFQVTAGVYKIRTALNNSSLVDMALTENSDRTHNVKLYHANDEPESTWQIHQAPNGKYRIKNGKHAHLSLTTSDDWVIAKSDNTTYPNMWTFKKADDEFVFIEAGSKVMDVRGSSTKDNTPIIVWPNQESRNQKFKLIKIRDL